MSTTRRGGARPHRRVSRLLALLGVAVVVVAGCATVPEETLPKAVTDFEPEQGTAKVPQPARNAAPRDIVRGFVESGGQTASNHAAARAYLTKPARSQWNADSGPTIIDENFNTVQAADRDQPDDPDKRIIMLQASNVGQLDPAKAFVPRSGIMEMPLTLHRQDNGQWRINDPPEGTIVTPSVFQESYFEVRLYFFDPDLRVAVPDPRYVVASPRSELPRQVIDLLLSGPSNSLAGAVESPIHEDATVTTRVADRRGGALVVPLTGLGELNAQTRKRIAAQIVLSLQSVTTSRIRVLADGAPLLEDKRDIRLSDLPSYTSSTAPATELPGLVADNGRIWSLGNGQAIQGPAGNGAYDIHSAAQSTDGEKLAVVESRTGGVRMRVGPLHGALQPVDLEARTLTRPTWRPALDSDAESTELWTVVDGEHVSRIVRRADESWESTPVNATELRRFGEITQLRLSGDGTRAAIVADGKLVVAGVVRDEQGPVSLRAPRQLLPHELKHVVSVAWQNQETLVAATKQTSQPVVRLPVDGLGMDAFDAANLIQPMRRITAAPGRPVIAVDDRGMSVASDIGEVWYEHDHDRGPGSWPFYPG